MTFRVHFTITESETGKVIAKGTADYERLGVLAMAMQGNSLVSLDVVRLDPEMDTTIIDFKNCSC